MLIDTHAHLTDERFDAERIIADMPADGLERIVTVGFDMPSSEACASIAERHENVYFAVGVHPSDSQQLTSDPCARLIGLAAHPKCVAIGEIGLDYHYPDTDKEKQQYWLRRQLDVATECGLPVCFHVRDAYGDFEAIMEEYAPRLKAGAVMHCYSGSPESAKKYLSYGFYLSFSGSITFPNAKKYAEIIPAVPSDRVLVETDCPYLTPQPYRGQLNYPRNVRCQAEEIARLTGKSFDRVAAETTENARRIFFKMR